MPAPAAAKISDPSRPNQLRSDPPVRPKTTSDGSLRSPGGRRGRAGLGGDGHCGEFGDSG